MATVGQKPVESGDAALQSLTNVWSSLDSRRRIVAIGAALAVFAAVLGLARGAGNPQMALLYGGLEAQAAGDVLAALEGQGVAYEVRSGAIYVPMAERDALRMSLAAEGLPANSAQGYELLDSLSGFGTTSQMFDAAYWRAKEGELARTILSSPHIRAVRVHISAPSSRPFAREERPTAAVTVTTADGALASGFAKALRYLVASAVPGLSAEDVAVIDGETGLVTAEEEGAGSEASRAEELRARAERLLEARVGYGNAIVEVSVETVTESEQITERRVDPDSRVAVSEEVSSSSGSSQNAGEGRVTVASNLPDGAANGEGGGGGSSENSESRELTNYDFSETSREVLRGPGAIRRLTVAVLVNELAVTGPETGEAVTEPRSAEELEALGALVASAVGLDESRGDELTVRAMAFQPTPMLTEGAEGLPSGSVLDMMQIIQLAVLALVALVLGLFVVRPILTGRRAAAALPEGEDSVGALPAPMGDAGGFGGGFPTMGNALAPPPGGEGDGGGLPGGFPAMGNGFGADGGGLPPLGGGDDAGGDPVTRLRKLIEERQDETIQILQSWIEDPEPEV
ncbi:flagellar basal-body MS-ring/collar protein FliF [Pseudoroseicyclus tamaricis]|uniref:Flagellar M-ring protein n=1 Tax=Pseudoroseicyclus tamaricis TaxID=2705421 RepID=A0A6B2JW68_9RHOB|nr:flagellar basal-body MS-ring/collar protein FliF [Pseudoroseicyclus tamaricis]NDV02528.1 flagellar M-ring protein FliF [Pseudoroseicyclus tamaricis]